MMKITVPFPYRITIRDALICQLFALALSGFIDGLEFFLLFIVPAWILFWVAIILLAKLRRAPTKTELFALRFGPLVLLVIVFVIGQYL